MASKSLGLTDGKGSDFYKFDDIEDSTDFITQWYTKLNSLDLTEEEKVAIVDEANLVFAFNVEILQELEGSAMKSFFTFAWKSLKKKFTSA
jgi:heme oxygenase